MCSHQKTWQLCVGFVLRQRLPLVLALLSAVDKLCPGVHAGLYAGYGRLPLLFSQRRGLVSQVPELVGSVKVRVHLGEFEAVKRTFVFNVSKNAEPEVKVVVVLVVRIVRRQLV